MLDQRRPHDPGHVAEPERQLLVASKCDVRVAGPSGGEASVAGIQTSAVEGIGLDELRDDVPQLVRAQALGADPDELRRMLSGGSAAAGAPIS